MYQKASAEPRAEPPKKVFVSYSHVDENAQKFLLMALGQSSVKDKFSME